MVRAVVGALHTFVAAALATDGLLWLLQSLVNTSWEHGFYGQVSETSLTFLVASIAALLFAGVQAGVGVAYALGRPWAVHGVLGVSIVLMLVGWYPLNLFMALAAGAGLLELAPRWEPEEEPEDD